MLDVDFERITVVLGANGTGESRLIARLRALKDSFWGDRPLTFVEGGRVVQAPTTVELNRGTVGLFRNLRDARRK